MRRAIKSATKAPSFERLRELFAVTEDGQLLRLMSVGYQGCKKAGTVAGRATRDGYVVTRVDGYRESAHRIVFALTHGRWPEGEIDHINGCRSDNRPANLRDVSAKTNMENRRKPGRSNTTGFLGVSRAGNRYMASITCNGEQKNLGRYATAEQAFAAYLSAKRQMHEGCTI